MMILVPEFIEPATFGGGDREVDPEAWPATGEPAARVLQRRPLAADPARRQLRPSENGARKIEDYPSLARERRPQAGLTRILARRAGARPGSFLADLIFRTPVRIDSSY